MSPRFQVPDPGSRVGPERPAGAIRNFPVR
jgi:hypothetical protein